MSQPAPEEAKPDVKKSQEMLKPSGTPKNMAGGAAAAGAAD